MYIHAGERLFGKVDRVPGLFHVRTLFFHINFIPLRPLGSRLIPEDRRISIESGIDLPLCRRSVSAAYLRCAAAILLLGSPFALLLGISLLSSNMEWQRAIRDAIRRWEVEDPLTVFADWLPGIVGSLIALTVGLWWFIRTWRVPRANLERAIELGSYLELSPDYVQARWQRVNKARRTKTDDIDRPFETCAECRGTGRIEQTGEDEHGLPWHREVACPHCK
jgi:hypothetical protein